MHNYNIMLLRALAISVTSDNFYHAIANAIATCIARRSVTEEQQPSMQMSARGRVSGIQ